MAVRDVIIVQRGDGKRGGSPAARFAAAIVTGVVLLAVICLGPAQRADAAGPPDTMVNFWDDAAVRACLASSSVIGGETFGYLGLVHTAIYDSVVATRGGYEPLVYKLTAYRGGSAEAAVAASAHRVLLTLLPGQAAIANDAYAASLALIPDSKARQDGLAAGEAAALAVLATKEATGIDTTLNYAAPSPPQPGVWESVANPPLRAIGMYLGRLTPNFLPGAAQYRPAGPPKLTSDAYTIAFNEVKSVGAKNSTTRTADQTAAALFWSENPGAQLHKALRKFVTDHHLNIVEATRFMAMTSVIGAESLVACFEAKYKYVFWRPILAIRRADTDGNDQTVKDETWEALIPTVNHPEYPSAHACATPATALMIANFLGTDAIDFTMESTVAGRPTRHFATAAALSAEVQDARIWGGIHFRFSLDDGSAIGRSVYDYLSARYFKPSPGGLGPDSGLTAPGAPNTGNGEAAGSSAAFSWAISGLVVVLLGGYLIIRSRRRT